MSLTVLVVVVATARCTSAQPYSTKATVTRSNDILWTDPGHINERNLFYGPGGEQGQPREPFTFLKEDRDGTNPKFDLRDSAGTKWRAKLGIEAQSEVVAARFLWAVGFVANENYLVQDATVSDLPRLKRGRKLVGPNGQIHFMRLQRPPGGAEKKVGRWKWRQNRFRGTREFNGLRVMMALLNNWDLKDSNNAIYVGRGNSGSSLYEVSDVGASFGMSGESYLASRAKNNLQAYRRSKFIRKVTPEYVSFNFPTHLTYFYVLRVKLFISQRRQRWIGQKIPRSDVEWIASLLSQLSLEQIRDAFRAGGYSPEQVEAYSAAVQARIAALTRL
jgi:hypothetical protein